MRPVRAISVLLAAVMIGGCASSYNWAWYIVSPWNAKGMSNALFLVSGVGWTLLLAICAISLSVAIGLPVALLSLSKSRFARALNRSYVEVLRSIPMLVMVLWVFYGLPIVLDIRLDVFAAGLLALALCDSAFEAEIFRGGIQSIERGQHEAADSLGLSAADKMRFIILPQALKRVLPPLGNQFVYMLKTSSLVSVIGLGELTRKANELIVTEYRPLEIYTFLILEYMVLILIASSGVRWLERRMGVSERRS